MKPKNQRFLSGREMATALVAFLVTANLHAEAGEGGREGHGGTGILCGDGVELAEFREVRVRAGLLAKARIVSSTEDVKVQVNRALSRLDQIDPEVAATAKRYAEEIQNAALPVASYDWGFSNDVNHYPAMDGCELKTIVHYFNPEVIEYRADLYDRLTPTGKAGLWVHEAIFRLTRERANENFTLPARRITALLFSEQGNEDLIRGFTAKYLSLRGKNDQVIDYDPSSGRPLKIFGKLISAPEGDVSVTGLHQRGKMISLSSVKSTFPMVIVLNQNLMGVEWDPSFTHSVTLRDDLGWEHSFTLRHEAPITSSNYSGLVYTIRFIPRDVRSFELGK